jgi:hypothetical protein
MIPAEISGGSALDAPSLGQVHVLSAVETASLGAIGSPAVNYTVTGEVVILSAPITRGVEKSTAITQSVEKSAAITQTVECSVSLM